MEEIGRRTIERRHSAKNTEPTIDIVNYTKKRVKRMYILYMKTFFSVLLATMVGCATVQTVGAEAGRKHINVDNVYMTLEACFPKEDFLFWNFFVGKNCPLDQKLILVHLQIVEDEIGKHDNPEIQAKLDAGEVWSRAVFTLGQPKEKVAE